MRLLRLHVENFGILHDFRLELSKGLNVLHEENGWGKSTLAAYIKAMFFGLPATTKRSLDENERKKYMPWQGGAFGGSLEFETQKGQFRIERFFDSKESGDTFCLYDCASNRPSGAYGERIGEELFGIDADGFERTVFLSQKLQTSKGENNSITAKLGNLLDDVDDIASFDDAVAALEKRRKFYTLTGNRGRIAELEQEQHDAQADLEALERVGEVLTERKKEARLLEIELQTLEDEQNVLRAEHRRAAVQREKRVLRDQKARMSEEIETLMRKRTEIEERLHGLPPSEEELETQKLLMERIRSARAEVDAIQNAPALREELTILPFGMNSRTPDETLFSKLRAENTTLQNICHREEFLQRIQRDGQTNGSTKYPDARTIDEMSESLKRAEHLKRECEESACPKTKKMPWTAMVSIAFFATGIGMLVLSRLPAFLAIHALLTVGTWVALAIGSLFGMVALRSVAVRRRRLKEICARHADLVRQRETILKRVSDFLVSYGIVPADGDRMRGLIELSLKAEQERIRAERNRGALEELALLDVQKREALAFLQTTFRSFGIALPVKNDYRDEIEKMNRDCERIQRFQKETTLHAERMERTQTEWKALCAQMRPFLQRFDPEHRMGAQECLQAVMNDSASHRRLTTEINEKTVRLQRFLDQNSCLRTQDTEKEIDENALAERENALLLRMRTKHEEYAALEQRIERMETDVERIPECLARLSQVSEALEEARANSTTISQTQKLLEEAKEALSTRYLADMQASFSDFLKLLYAQETPESVMDTSFDVHLRKEGKTRSMESFSRGWRDAVQFCLRLSLADALYKEGELPFLLLDDPFVNLDDYRLSAAKQLLVTLARRYQIIYMVCHADRT